MRSCGTDDKRQILDYRQNRRDFRDKRPLCKSQVKIIWRNLIRIQTSRPNSNPNSNPTFKTEPEPKLELWKRTRTRTRTSRPNPNLKPNPNGSVLGSAWSSGSQHAYPWVPMKNFQKHLFYIVNPILRFLTCSSKNSLSNKREKGFNLIRKPFNGIWSISKTVNVFY